MSNERKQPTCSHCLEEGHTKASPQCPRKGLDPTPRPEKVIAPNRWTPEKEQILLSLITKG